ncbi:hypothetical protein E2562_002600 [Oryza meyeriana var. granulata]|uniref:NAD-dependent epimerase/dehydratase domain-containing protein n=1 Tax=Oryza meyeriana var. granulata TaxID=110450 RepID=A0A6G1F361_9ORYZ|nr:hypothetical protein E2562_002600 [Oryza meyeriana var. granulata]
MAVEEGRSGRGALIGDGVRVCVTGGAGFIASWLVKKLLARGCTVHATQRSIGDEEKAVLLRRLVPGAAERLRLFEADLFDAPTFARARRAAALGAAPPLRGTEAVLTWFCGAVRRRAGLPTAAGARSEKPESKAEQ